MSDVYILRMNAVRCQLLAACAAHESLSQSLLALAREYEIEADAVEAAVQPRFAF